MSEPRLVVGDVVYGVPRLLAEARRCDRCGQERRAWSWWAVMLRPDGDRPLGEACPDCHAV